jgi:hypothetical protein
MMFHVRFPVLALALPERGVFLFNHGENKEIVFELKIRL